MLDGTFVCRLLAAFGRDDVVHAEVLDELAVVIPGVDAVFEGDAEASGGASGPGRDVRSGDDFVRVIDGGDGAVHVGERVFEVVKNLGLGVNGEGAVFAGAHVDWRFLQQHAAPKQVVVGGDVA